MKVFKNYHVTGGKHDVEFFLKGEDWFYRLRWAPEEWRPMKSMKGVLDGDGVFWGEVNGRPIFRLTKMDKTNQWDGAKYPELEPERIAAPRADEPQPQTIAAPPASGILSLEDLMR